MSLCHSASLPENKWLHPLPWAVPYHSEEGSKDPAPSLQGQQEANCESPLNAGGLANKFFIK